MFRIVRTILKTLKQHYPMFKFSCRLADMNTQVNLFYVVGLFSKCWTQNANSTAVFSG